MQLKTSEKLFQKSDIKDYTLITFGLALYAFAWGFFLLPYQISTGGTAGIGAIIYYATGFPLEYTYFMINCVLFFVSLKILGLRFTVKTGYAIVLLTLFLKVSQFLVQNYVDAEVFSTLADGNRVPLILGEGQEFMATIIGSAMCGFALGTVFNANGSTGGTDIVAACVNKYRDISLGTAILMFDLCVISSCYFVFHSWQRVIFGLCSLAVASFVVDYTVNKRQSSTQFFIFSKHFADIADRVNRETGRGCTVINGEGWYTKSPVKILIVVASRRQSNEIFRLVKSVDPHAFITQSSVMGAYGEGFKTIKQK